MRLADKPIIVTGAGRGIGEGIARRFGREGALAARADLDGDAANKTADAINDAAGQARAEGVVANQARLY